MSQGHLWRRKGEAKRRLRIIGGKIFLDPNQIQNQTALNTHTQEPGEPGWVVWAKLCNYVQKK